MNNDVNELDFTIEFNSPLATETEGELFVMAEEQLNKLRKGHQDMIGAAINIREPAKGEKGFLYEATVVVYSRPEHLSATEKDKDFKIALKGALDAVERQIRQRRDKLSQKWEEPEKGRIPQEVLEVVMAEENAIDTEE